MSSDVQHSATVVLYDLSSLRFRRRGSALTVLSAAGEELSHLEGVADDDRQAVAAALEDAAGRSVVWRDGEPCRVAFYHPDTAQVSLGAWPRGTVLGCGAPLALEREGTTGRLEGDTVVLADGSVLVPQDDVDLVAVSRLLAR